MKPLIVSVLIVELVMEFFASRYSPYNVGSRVRNSVNLMIFFFIYIIFVATPGPGVYSADHRNVYRKKIINVLGSRAQPALKADKLNAICKPIVLTRWDPPQPYMTPRLVTEIALLSNTEMVELRFQAPAFWERHLLQLAVPLCCCNQTRWYMLCSLFEIPLVSVWWSFDDYFDHVCVIMEPCVQGMCYGNWNEGAPPHCLIFHMCRDNFFLMGRIQALSVDLRSLTHSAWVWVKVLTIGCLVNGEL